MKKKGILALLLACIMCLNFSTAMAAGYNVDHDNVSGGTVTTIGQLTSPTMFYGKTTWTADTTIGGEVSVSAATFAIFPGNTAPVQVETGIERGNRSCSIDQTHEDFSACGTYAITEIDFVHFVHDEETMLLRYMRTISY